MAVALSSVCMGHALDCKKGELITQRHNELRDALGDIAALTTKRW